MRFSLSPVPLSPPPPPPPPPPISLSHTLSPSHKYTHYLSRSLSHTSLSLTHTHTCLSLSLTHTHTHTHTHTQSLSPSHTSLSLSLWLSYLDQDVSAKPHTVMPSSSQTQESCCIEPETVTKSGKMGRSKWHVPTSSTSTFVDSCGCAEPPWTCRVMRNDRSIDSSHHKWLASRKTWMLRSMRHYTCGYTIGPLEERGVRRGSSRRLPLEGRERAIISQTRESELGERQRQRERQRARRERWWGGGGGCFLRPADRFHSMNWSEN